MRVRVIATGSGHVAPGTELTVRTLDELADLHRWADSHVRSLVRTLATGASVPFHSTFFDCAVQLVAVPGSFAAAAVR